MNQTPNTTPGSEETVQDRWKYDPNYHRMADYLGINKYDRDELEVAEKISTIYDWGELKSDKKGVSAALGQVNRLQKDLGVPYLGKELVKKLYEYVRLEMDKERINSQIKSYGLKNREKDIKVRLKPRSSPLQKQIKAKAKIMEEGIDKMVKVSTHTIKNIQSALVDVLKVK